MPFYCLPMPVYDYKSIAETAKQTLLTRKDITDENKKYLKEFITHYETKVSHARQHIFYSHVWQFLRFTKNIKKDMKDRKEINSIFNNLQKNLSLSHYATVVSVSLTFVRWINDGNKPEGFKDIQSPKKKKLKRDLSKEDMITWEDGLLMAKNTPSSQMKAIILTQLDGGFRPSEFVDLSYGDIEFKKPFLIAHIKNGKTGARDVVLFKCVPYLQRWLNDHPTKDPKDPLWIIEYQNNVRKEVKNNIMRYQYFAIRKRILQIGSLSKINKPLDFYNLRHSACRLAKLENMPLEMATKKFGHSAEYFTNTYARLDINDELKRHQDFLGLNNKGEIKKEITVFCETCKHINPPNSEICEQCQTPLTVQKALEMKSEKDQEIEKLKNQVNAIYSFIEKSGLSQQILNNAKERKFERTKKNELRGH